MVAAGPFTLDDDLLYQPLSALLEVVSEERPDVLILVSQIGRSTLISDGPIHRCQPPIDCIWINYPNASRYLPGTNLHTSTAFIRDLPSYYRHLDPLSEGCHQSAHGFPPGNVRQRYPRSTKSKSTPLLTSVD
jgi:hypothetical protein